MNLSKLGTGEDLAEVDYKISEIVRMIEDLPQLKGRLSKSALATLHGETQPSASMLTKIYHSIVDFFMMEYSLMHLYGQNKGKELLDMVNDAIHLIRQRDIINTPADRIAIQELSSYVYDRTRRVYDFTIRLDGDVETDPEFMKN